jgi:predicted ArsR family transcriptional regulator
MPKLTDTQQVILSAAAGRSDHTVLPLPKSLRASKGAATSAFKRLLKRGLIEERPAVGKTAVWRTDRAGCRLTLIVSDLGLSAINAEPTQSPSQEPAVINKSKASPKPSKKPSQSGGIRPSGKNETILELLLRPKGVKIAELQKATGWQAHSVRAALTGLRKHGITIDHTKNASDETVYKASRA